MRIEQVLKVSSVATKDECAKMCYTQEDACHWLLEIRGNARNICTTPPREGSPIQKPMLTCVGRFEGINLRTGEHLQSGVLQAPESILNFIVQNPGQNNPVALRLGVKRNAKSVSGYQIVADTIDEVEVDDLDKAGLNDDEGGSRERAVNGGSTR